MRSRQIFAVFLGLLAIGFFGSCSNVNFEEKPNSACNGSGVACTSAFENGRKVNLYSVSSVVPEPKADILFVVDNSKSMRSEQLKMAERFRTFTDSLTSIDWRIAITTTDVTSTGMGGKLLSFASCISVLTSQVSNFESLFYNTIQRPEEGSNDERGITSAIRVVQNRKVQGFLRPEAHFSTIVLSDEDERSAGGVIQGYPLTSEDNPSDFVRAIEQYQGEIGTAKSYSFYSIIIKPGDSACLAAQAGQDFKGYEGKLYFELQKFVNAGTGSNNSEVGSICDSDYTKNLRSIADSLVEKIKPIPLPCVPIMEPSNRTLAYTIQRPDAASFALNESRLNERLLDFSPRLPPGTRVDYSFKCYAN